MFSIKALDSLGGRGKSQAADVISLREYAGDAAPKTPRRRSAVLPIVRFAAASQVVALAFLAAAYLPAHPAMLVSRAMYAGAAWILLVLVLILHIGLLGGRSGPWERGLGLANRLTIVRFVLVVPLIALIVDGRFMLGLGVYAVCLATDVLDGIVARKKEQPSEFGTIMDPLADIASTAGVFGAFLAEGLIPTWVFVVLMVRYLSLFAGTAVLFLTVGPPKFRATPVGKIVGVLQGIAGIMIIVLAASGIEWQEDVGGVLFPFLGIIFGSVIVSQLVLAIRHIRKGPVNAGS